MAMMMLMVVMMIGMVTDDENGDDHENGDEDGWCGAGKRVREKRSGAVYEILLG